MNGNGNLKTQGVYSKLVKECIDAAWAYFKSNAKKVIPDMKVMDRDTKNLVDGLRQIGLFANVYVSEKKEEVDITTCREFFDNSKLGLLDRRV